MGRLSEELGGTQEKQMVVV